MEEVEEWKPVLGYEKAYEVSNLGRIKSLQKRSWNRYAWVQRPCRVMSPSRNTGGYIQVKLSLGAGSISRLVHVLVAEVFLVKPDGLGWKVNHKDFNKINNKVSNLEWITSEENNRHAGLAGRHPGYKVSVEQVTVVRHLISTGRSVLEVANITGVNRRTVYDLIEHEHWSESP